MLPQLIWLILQLFALLYFLTNKKEEFIAHLCSVLISNILLYWGGFFDILFI